MRLSALLHRFALIRVVAFLWPFIRPQRRDVLIASAVTLGLTVVEVASPVAVGFAVEGVLGQLQGVPAQGVSGEIWYGLIGALFLAASLRGYLLARQKALAGIIGQGLAARLRDRVWKQLQELPLEFTERRGPGRMILRFIGDTRSIQRLVTEGLVQLSQDLLVAVGVIGVLLWLNWRMALAIVVLLPVYAGLFLWINPRLRRRSRATRRRRARLSAYLHDRMSGMAEMKAYTRRKVDRAAFRGMNRQLASRASRLATEAGRLQGISVAAVSVGTPLVLVLAANEAAAGRVTAGTLIAFLTLTGLLAPIFERVALANRYLQESRISIDRLQDVLSHPVETDDEEVGRELTVTEGTIVAEDVLFRYGEEPPVLDGVSLEARRGEVTAIVGENGAGKSTLIDLLLRFQEPEGGRVLVDGQDINEVTPASVRRAIGYVGARVSLFDGTLDQNVEFGYEEEATEEQVRRAARLAGLDEVAATLPNGWETRIDEGRRALSQGQLRRVGLARALVADPPILVLDEVLAGADERMEARLGETLQALAEARTVIVAAQRVPSALDPDRVYRLDGGRAVLVSGSPERNGDGARTAASPTPTLPRQPVEAPVNVGATATYVVLEQREPHAERNGMDAHARSVTPPRARRRELAPADDDERDDKDDDDDRDDEE